MTVLVCIPCLLNGGTEIQTLNLVKALVEGGHKVITACYFEYNSGMVAEYEKQGSKVVCFSESGNRVNGLKSVTFLFSSFRKLLKQNSIDVAHVQYMAPGAIPIIILRLLGVKTVIATAHTDADIYSSLRVVHFVQRYCLRAFTCITQTAEKSFFGCSRVYNDSLKLERHNHFTIYNALPASIPTIEIGRKFSSDIVTIGVVSRLEKIKGMDLVVPAFAKVVSRRGDVRLLVVGDGLQRRLMEEQSVNCSVSQFCEFVGKKTQEELTKYYDKIDILLMPSRSEGFGLTAIEGMARGCVVVAANVGGLPEVVKDRFVGLIHNANDIEDLSQKIISLIDDKSLMQSYSDRAVEYVGRFDYATYSASIIDLYKQLCIN